MYLSVVAERETVYGECLNLRQVVMICATLVNTQGGTNHNHLT